MKKKQKQIKKPSKFIAGLLLIILSGVGWWLWNGMLPSSPRFNSILISINGEPHNILPEETLRLHSTDKVHILEISTNILLNINVRLVSEGFDANALRQGETNLATLLPDQNIFNKYKFKIRVEHRTKNLGYTYWELQPYAEDWLEQANRTINKNKKIEVLKHGLSFLPEDSSLQRKLLDEYKAQKQWKHAASMLEEMTKKDPNEESLNELVDIYAAMSSKAKITSVLKKLVTLDPANLNSRLQLAKILEERGKHKSAIKEYEELVKRVDKKDRLSIYKSLGYLYAKIAWNKSAIKYYLKAAKIDKKDINLYYNLSGLYEKTKQKDKALTYLEKAVRLNAKDLTARLDLAGKFLKKGDLKKAGKYVSEILKKKPSSTKALLIKAQILGKQKNKKELENTYKKILTLDKNNATVIYNLGVLNYEKGDLKASLTYISKYVKKYPKDIPAHEIIFDIYNRQENETMAFKEAQTLVKLKPQSIDLYNFIFDYLNERGDYKKIIQIMRQGVEANPKQTEPREHLLFACLKTGDDDLAIKQIDELLKTTPGDIELLLWKAKFFEKQEKVTKALETYEKIINISPEHEEAENSYLRLKLYGIRNM